MCYVYANLHLFHVNLRQGINGYKSLPKHKTIIDDLDNIIQDFKTVRLGLYIAKSMLCAHFNERTDKTDKIVA